MLKLFDYKRAWCWFLILFAAVSVSAQDVDANKDCSEKAKDLITKAWAAQPLSVPKNSVSPAKAASLYQEAIGDSPKCRRAIRLLVGLSIRRDKYVEANRYNEILLGLAPDDPGALSNQAILISRLNKDYSRALAIEMKLLDVPDFNKNGNVFYGIARIYSLLNKLDESLDYLKMAVVVDPGWGDRANAQASWGFENLRKDKRFWAFVKKT